MPIYLKYNTASQEVPLGYFVDSTDGNTEETALTINNTDIKLWKTGATTLANKNSGGATHISNGVYYAVLDATDTDTVGPLVIFVHVSGALAVRVECVVLPANVYDSLISGSDKLQTDPTQESVDGITIQSLFECLLAFMAGKAVVTDNGTTRTIEFYKQNGSTKKLAITAAESDGGRAATGTLDPA